ncbi:hypothetical protein LCGC14_0367160 [marine sediment metagenome]|uniref:Uncharacterized protein n=1 Tax=marine sediment metagenome TaxID=412755 RepID=A0A0F9T675_9ZZZZ
MANVQISDLPFATIPLVGATTFFEVEATEGGVVVSRRVAADDLVVSATTLFIDGTSVDDPAIGGGVFDGQLLWRNANAQQTGVFGFDPAGDNFIWSNDAEGGFHQIAIRDGTVLVESIAAAAGGLLVNNLLTGAGLERVLTAADLFAGVVIGTSSDDPTNPAGGGTYDGTLGYQNSLFAATGEAGFDPAGDTFRAFNRVRRGSFAVRVITSGGVEEDTYRYDGFLGSHVWLDVLNAGLTRMSLLAGNSSVIISGGVNPPSTGAGQTGNFRMTLQDGTETGEMGFGSSVIRTDLEIKNFVHGAQVRLTGEDGAGVERILVLGDPDGVAQLHFAGTATLRTITAATGGAEANNTLTGAGFERVLTSADLFAGVFIGTSTDDPTVPGGTFDANAQWQNANLLPLANVGFDPAGDTLFLASQVHGGRIILRGEDEAGNVRDVYEIDFENVVGGLAHLWREPGGTQLLMRLDTGVNAVTQVENSTNQPSGGFAQVGVFRVRNRNATPETAFTVGFNETIGQTTLELKNFVHGGAIELIGETAAGLERVMFFTDPDQRGPIIFGLDDNDPAVDASVQDARMTFRNPSADNIWQIGFLEGTNDFSLKLFQDTGVLQLRGSSAASADVLMATFDPVAGTELFHAAVATPKIRTTANGFDMLGDTATNSDFDLYSLDGATLRASVRTDGAGLRIASQVNSLSVTIFARSGAGAELAGLQVTGSTGITQLYFSGAIKLLTQNQGVTIRGNAAANAQLLIEGSGGVDMLTVACTSTLISFVSELDGSTVRFRGSDLGASIRTLWEADPDGDFSAFRVGGLRAGTRFDGWRILGLLNNVPSAGGTQDVSLEFQNNVGTIAGAVRYNTSIDMRIENFVHGGSILMLAEDSGGTLRFLLDMDPTGPNSVQLHEVGVSVARTATAALGGLFANNTLTGAGFERVLTTADRTDASVYTRNAVIVEDRTLLASASATTLNNNNVLAALIADLQSADIIQ